MDFLVQKQTERNINYIVIHCSDTPPSRDTDAAEIARWHINGNGWSDIGYHYVIKRDGTVEKGREDSVTGAHVRGHNTDSIGICLVGGKRGDGDATFNFTMNQVLSLNSLVYDLHRVYPDARICGHRDLDSAKECPGFDVKYLFEEL